MALQGTHHQKGVVSLGGARRTKPIRRRGPIESRTWVQESCRRCVVYAESDKEDTLGNLDAILAGSGDETEEEQPVVQETPMEEDGAFVRQQMSEAQKAKLRQEYLSFGGSANTVSTSAQGNQHAILLSRHSFA